MDIKEVLISLGFTSEIVDNFWGHSLSVEFFEYKDVIRCWKPLGDTQDDKFCFGKSNEPSLFYRCGTLKEFFDWFYETAKETNTKEF